MTDQIAAGDRENGARADSQGAGAADAVGASDAPGPGVPDELTAIRHSIDNIDAALIHLLAERFSHTKRVGRLKARYGLPPADPQREARQIARLRALALEADLDPDFAEKFLGFLVTEVIRHHRAIAREEAATSSGEMSGESSGPGTSSR